MMSMQISGIDDVKKILEEMAPKKALNLITATTRGIATEVKKEAKQTAKSSFDKRSGVLLKSINVKKRRSDKYKPTFNVTFESSKNNGFYWLFLEHGTKDGIRATHFMRKARLNVEVSLDMIITQQFTKKFESSIKRELKKQANKNK